MKKKCPRCSGSFTCREDRNDLCNCAHIYLEPGTKDYVKDFFESCLCPSCLKEVSNTFHSFGINPKYKIEHQID